MTSNNFFAQNYISENQQINFSILAEKGVTLFIKREDKIHPEVSGNKFRKLKYNIQEAKRLGKKTLVTFGGAFSNHILAVATAGKIEGFRTIGIIRGEELATDLQKTLSNNSTLRKASENGMTFEFVSREVYKEKWNVEFLTHLKEKFGDFYLIPEGGTNHLAINGCEEILNNGDKKFDFITCAVGTGGTISGLINASKDYQKIIGFTALKGDFLKDEIKTYTSKENWSLETNYHFGGYAKYNQELIRFINAFKQETDILLDPIYTGKMIFGIIDMVKNDIFERGSKILAVHTGGIQGIDGFNQKLNKKNQQTILI